MLLQRFMSCNVSIMVVTLTEREIASVLQSLLSVIGLVTMTSMSAFSLVGTMVLIVMNPIYHCWLKPVISRLKTITRKLKITDGSRSVVVIMPQQHTRSHGETPRRYVYSNLLTMTMDRLLY